MEKLECQVLIVGAGPTGLMAANQLMCFGIDFIIIDKKNGPTRESRALAVTARSLEIYQQMGLAQQAIDGGSRVEALQIFSGGNKRVEVKIGEIGTGLSEFNYMLIFEQSKNEELLYHNLKAGGQEVMWETDFIELREYEKGIEAVVKKNSALLQINAAYLLACDGANSPVRHQLNFSFKGGTYKHKFFVADTVVEWKLGHDKLILAPGAENFCAFLPMKGGGNYRLIGTMPEKYFEYEDIGFRDIENVVKSTLGLAVKFKQVNWFSIYKLHHRGVKNFRKARVFLAGDSAHIHSPAGGQGMNTGLQDAYNLCWKMAMVLRNKANPGLLDTYNEERLPFAKWLLSFTDRGFNMMTSGHSILRFFRKYLAIPMAGKILSQPFIQFMAFRIISQTGYHFRSSGISVGMSRQKLKFKAGDRLPFFRNDNIYPHFAKASFHLLHIGSGSIPDEQKKIALELCPFPVEIVEEKLDEKWAKLGVRKELNILVRPDNYIGYVCDEIRHEDFNRYLRKYFIL